MREENVFNWINLIPGLNAFPNHIVMAVLVAVTLIVTTFVARLQLVAVMRRPDQGIVPEPHLTYRNFFEIIAEKLYGLTENVIGHHNAPIYFPVIGSLFVFIFVSNIVGLIPGLLPPTENINTTIALGIFVFIFYNIQGLRTHGMGYLKHFLGPFWPIAPLMLVIEIVSHIFRPISLAFRLRGNIMGDHLVLGVFNGLVPYLIPVVFYGLGVFVAFIQAFVFCLMTMVYISLSTAHDH